MACFQSILHSLREATMLPIIINSLICEYEKETLRSISCALSAWYFLYLICIILHTYTQIVLCAGCKCAMCICGILCNVLVHNSMLQRQMCWLNAFPPSIKISSASLELSDIFVIISLTQCHLNLLYCCRVSCTAHRSNDAIYSPDVFHYLDFDYIAICDV